MKPNKQTSSQNGRRLYALEVRSERKIHTHTFILFTIAVLYVSVHQNVATGPQVAKWIFTFSFLYEVCFVFSVVVVFFPSHTHSRDIFKFPIIDYLFALSILALIFVVKTLNNRHFLLNT